MKKIYLLLFAAAFTITAFSQIGGDLDPTFGNGGKVIKSINTGADIARGLAILNNGSFLVVGETYSGVSGKDFFCTKFLTSGALDVAFGTNGTITTDLQTGSEDVAFSIAVDDVTGKFVVAGSSSDGTKQYAALVRYQSNGLRDSAFGVNGIVLTNCIANNADAFRKVKINALSGKIIAAGNSIYSTTAATAVIARYDSNGSPDATFNATGINVFPTLGNAYTDLKDIYVAPSGKITAVGYTTDDNLSFLYAGWLTRLNSSGTPDLTFGTNGAFYEDYMSYNNAMYLDPGTGLIYTAGSVVAYFGTGNRNERMTIKRAGANGTDDSWAYAGQNPYHYVSPGGAPCYANAMCVTPDGHFFLAGTTYVTNQKASILMKLESTGGGDYTFGTPSTAQIVEDFGATYMETFDMVLQPDGKVVVVGYTGNDLFIARYFGTTVPRLSSFNLVSPANNSTDVLCSDVTLDWSEAPGATGYEIQIDSVITFPHPDTGTTSVNTEYPPYFMDLETGTSYFWRVRAYNDDSVGAWKGPWKFTTPLDNVLLNTPVDGAVNVATTGVQFDWNDLLSSLTSLQESFDFQISTSPSFTGAPVISGLSFSTSGYNYTASLLPNTTYYWRVRSNRCLFNKGPWSAASHFTTVDPSEISETGRLRGISIFPNPASDFIAISGLETAQAWTAQLYDLQGSLTHTVITRNEIDITGVSPGIYFLRLNTSEASGWYRFVKK